MKTFLNWSSHPPPYGEGEFNLHGVIALYGEQSLSDIYSMTLTPLGLHPLALQLANVQPLLGVLVPDVLSGSQ